MADELRITVIATGFGEQPSAAVASRPQPPAPAIDPADELRGLEVAPDGRPIKRLGLREVDEYELDVPTWQRRQQTPSAVTAERPVSGRRPNGHDADDAEFDVPTFLRRSLD